MSPSALVIPSALIAAIERAAEDAYPEESCGLLAGRFDSGGRLVVTRVRASANLAAGDRRAAFEVDPAVRFALMREIADTGETIVGHYHSHPDHPAEPSARDLAMAFEPELIWLITRVAAGRAEESRVFAVVLADGGGGERFAPLPLAVEPPR